MLRSLALLVVALSAFMISPARAQESEVPYWASIKATELYMRVGPSKDYRIEWVFKRKGLPIKVIRRVEAWRLVEDPDGARGWVSASLLSLKRSAITIGDGVAALRAGPDASSPLRWNVEPGVVGFLGKCESGFCEFDTDGHTGWVRADRLWGAGEP